MILNDINRILGITDSYQAPDRILDIILGDERKRDILYSELLDYFKCDMSYDWFHQYFEDEHADRKNNKQDFTPDCLSALVSELLQSDNGVTYEPSAGTGGMIIKNWYRNRSSTDPFLYKPNDHLVICSELSDKTIPFLLLNLSIRGISGMVIHGNTLTGERKNVYVLTNVCNSPIYFSSVTVLKNNS